VPSDPSVPYRDRRRAGLDLTGDDRLDQRSYMQTQTSLARDGESFKRRVNDEVTRGIGDVTKANNESGQELSNKIKELRTQMKFAVQNDSSLARYEKKKNEYQAQMNDPFAGEYAKQKRDSYSQQYKNRRAAIETPYVKAIQSLTDQYERYTAVSSQQFESTREDPPLYVKEAPSSSNSGDYYSSSRR
jgi:hypothetical protein